MGGRYEFDETEIPEAPEIPEPPKVEEMPRDWQPSQEDIEAIVGPEEANRPALKESDASTTSDASDAPWPQEQQAIESLKQVEAIRPEVWEGLNDSEKLEVLQDVENRMADVQSRPPVDVIAQDMPRGKYGVYDGEKLIVNAESLHNDYVAENVDTVVHEGRHAYQHYAVEHPEIHPNPAEVEAWRGNLPQVGGEYIPYDEDDPEAYRTQPIEADAWAYTERIRHGLYGGTS